MKRQEISFTSFLANIKALSSLYTIFDDFGFSIVFYFLYNIEHEAEVQEQDWYPHNLLKRVDIAEQRHVILVFILPHEVNAEPYVEHHQDAQQTWPKDMPRKAMEAIVLSR